MILRHPWPSRIEERAAERWPVSVTGDDVASCLLESANETEGGLGDFPPAGIDRERVPAARELGKLSHGAVPSLMLVRRPGHR
jgi:hypothetical protein